jgi:hypothetical protein
VIFSTALCGEICAQKKEVPTEKTYKINPWIDGGIIVTGAAFTSWGLNSQESLPPLPLPEVLALDPNDVNAFDRGAIYKDQSKLEQSLKGSDIALNLTTISVLLLGLDRRARHHWVEGIVMYVEALSINAATQSWVAYGTNRIRPIAYMDGVEISKRTDKRNKNSFYSGHASSAATSSFFMAKMYSDLHPELGNKKLWLFAAALIPPAIVGNFRIGAGKHFYTDVIIGTAMGATTGILTPHFHKIEKSTGVGFRPLLSPDFLGLYCKLRL